MKVINTSKLWLALVAMLMATTVHANINFTTENLHLTDADFGTMVAIPIKAHFDSYVDVWELNLSFPQGLTPVGISYGWWGMNLTYLDSHGTECEYTAEITANENYTHIIGHTLGSLGYQLIENDEGEMVYEPYGSVKWEPNYYDHLFAIQLVVDESFEGGEIEITGNASCGYDTRFDTSNFTPDPAIVGYTIQADVNGDGSISIADASILLNYLSGCEPSISGGDVHQDGVIDLLDYEELMDFIRFQEWYTGYQLSSFQSSKTVDITYMPVNDPTDVLFYIDDLEITPAEQEKEITIPVHARFGNYISCWDVEFIFPEGITPRSATKGNDMTMTYYDEDGKQVTGDAHFFHNNSCTHFISMPVLDEGNLPPLTDDDWFEPYGSVKWAAGEYDEMFFITCRVSPDFAGGYIQIITNASCGYDTRNDMMHFEPYPNQQHDPDGYNYPPGDVNLDGQINIADVVNLVYYLLDGYEISDMGDANHDDAINIVDVDATFDLLIHGQWYAGYVLSQGIAEATFEVPVPDPIGDVNGDGAITIKDVTTLITMLMEQANIEYNENLDVDGDGSITIKDVTALINKLLNKQ